MDRIKNWFCSMGSEAQSFMYGRYGYDELPRFLSRASLLCIRNETLLPKGGFLYAGEQKLQAENDGSGG